MKINVSRRQKIKIRVEINEIGTKKTIEKINKTKRWSFEKKCWLTNILLDSLRKKGDR